eukprot:1918969-Rhodomonas_salina.1
MEITAPATRMLLLSLGCGASCVRTSLAVAANTSMLTMIRCELLAPPGGIPCIELPETHVVDSQAVEPSVEEAVTP